MADTFKAVKVSDRVYWVGAVDWAVRDFHGYLTGNGSTYNAYLVLGDAPVLIDTVKGPFVEEMLARIASVVDPCQISTIISNHSEMDHSGALPEVIRRLQPKTVYASSMGVKALRQHFHLDRDICEVKDGESLCLEGLRFLFAETRMLHWPDSMFSFLADEKILFSQDAFGMHLATSERFADEIPQHILEWEGAKYYGNILVPFSPLVKKLLDKVPGLGWDIQIIAPDHGPVWRKDLGTLLQWYSQWSSGCPGQKAVVVYDTMWESTGKMARAMADGLAAGGVSVKVMKLRSAHRSDVAAELLGAGAFLVGSPTMNNQLFPTIADLLTYVRGLKPQNLTAACFGSYGWSGEAVGQVGEILKSMKTRLVGEGIKCSYVPDDKVLQECRNLGGQVADEMKKI